MAGSDTSHKMKAGVGVRVQKDQVDTMNPRGRDEAQGQGQRQEARAEAHQQQRQRFCPPDRAAPTGDAGPARPMPKGKRRKPQGMSP